MKRRTIIVAAATTLAAGAAALAIPDGLSEAVTIARLRTCAGLDAFKAQSVADYQSGRIAVRDGWIVSASENELLDQMEAYGLPEVATGACPTSL